ncbi:hypothetical protein AHAS_Ahas15G0182200 [Arachis hypogaea]
MSDRGKEKVTSRKRKKPQSSAASPFTDYAKNPLSEKDKADQQLPPTNVDRFPNLYCELRFPTYRKKNLNIEKKLSILTKLRRSIETCIEGMGLGFVDRELGRVNTSWVPPQTQATPEAQQTSVEPQPHP